MMLSGHKPRNLKRGRVDIAVYNEAQNQHQAGFIQLRGAIADRGGLVIAACNPPDQPIGRWVEDFYTAAVAKKVDGEAFDFAPRNNPWINYSALASMSAEVDEKTYRREIDGEFMPIGDVVFYAWSDRFNWCDVPKHYIDVTYQITRKHFGRPFAYVVGMDFQQQPHMAARVLKFFENPEEPGVVLVWVVDEVTPEKTDEFGLLDALESLERWTAEGRVEGEHYRGWTEVGDDPNAPTHCAVVMDASGFFQDGAHTKGQTSDKALMSRGWRFLYKPQKDSDRNPEIKERVKYGNAMCCSSDKKRRFFVSLHCTTTVNEFRQWENKNGIPNRSSEFAHGCDAVTYVLYRFFGRPKPKKKEVTEPRGYTGVRRLTRGSEMRRL